MARVIKTAKRWMKLGLAATGMVALMTAVASGQQSINSIEVLVNDEPISSFDINQRLRLVIAVAGGVQSEQEFLKVREQVIQSMVDERLQLQEAATVELVISQGQLDDFFTRRAQSVGQAPDQFEQALLGIGSSKATMQKQMEAELAWSQLVQGRLGSFVSVSDEEVEAYIQRIYDNRGKFEYRLAEIVLLVNSPEQEASVKATADELTSRIRSGAAFPEIAQQLSASSSAAVGGDIGWIVADDLEGPFEEAVNSVEVGEVGDPIRTPGGYVILAVRDRRRILTADPLDTQVSLRQLLLSTEKTSDASLAEKFTQVTENLYQKETSCAEVQQLADESGADGRVEIGVLRLRDLQGDMRLAVQDIEEGAATPLFKMEDGWRVLFVCGRQAPEVQEPDFDQVYNQLEQQRLSMMARRYLRDLRRDAIIDYR